MEAQKVSESKTLEQVRSQAWSGRRRNADKNQTICSGKSVTKKQASEGPKCGHRFWVTLNLLLGSLGTSHMAR